MAGYIVNQDIFDAIHRRHWLQFRIGQFIHVVEPHCYYVENGKQLLQAWHLLTAGSDPNVPVGWVHYQTDEMRDVRMLAEHLKACGEIIGVPIQKTAKYTANCNPAARTRPASPNRAVTPMAGRAHCAIPLCVRLSGCPDTRDILLMSSPG